MGLGGYYAWAAWGASVAATISTTAGTISAYLADKWTSVQNLVSHFQSHGQQIASILQETEYTLEMYAADAVWVTENGIPLINRLGQNVFVRFMATTESGVKFAYIVVNETGRIITFWAMGLSELGTWIPNLFKVIN